MKKTIFFVLSFLTGICLLSCKKEHIASINQLVKDLFCFKEGSTWTYYDSVSQKTCIMNISKYEELKIVSTPKLGGQIYEGHEHITITGYLFTEFELNINAQGDTKDNTATLRGTYISPYHNNTHYPIPLYFTCDANNHFNITVTCMPEYILGEKYTKVYLFEYENTNYYIARHVGLIRLHKINEFDLVLIDKNVIQ
jgi:hypothetical protein